MTKEITKLTWELVLRGTVIQYFLGLKFFIDADPFNENFSYIFYGFTLVCRTWFYWNRHAVTNLYTNRIIRENRWNTHLSFYVTQEVFCSGEIQLHGILSTVQVNFPCISSRIYTMHINVSTTVAEFVGRHNNNALLYLVSATISCV